MISFAKAAICVLFVLFLVSCGSAPRSIDDPFGVDRSRFSQNDVDLFYAVRGNNLARVEAALRDNPNVNVSDRLGQTAFMWACWNGNLDIIRALLNYDDMHIRLRTRRHQRLNVGVQSRNPDLVYNALFAFIMSGINPHDPEAVSILNRIIDRKNVRALEGGDFYGETVIHKIIRSGNVEFFDAVAERLDSRRKERLLNRESGFGQSPLQLAVQLGNRRAIDWLIDKVIDNGITIEGFDDPRLPMLAFDDGNGDLGVFIGIFRGKIIKDLPRIANTEFWETAIIAGNHGGPIHRTRVAAFSEVHTRFLEGGVTIDNLDYLNPAVFAEAEAGILEMVAGLEMSDVEKDDFFARLELFPELADAQRIGVDGNRRTVLHYIIERQNLDVFERFVLSPARYRLRIRPSGYIHYLNLAMMNRRIEHMRFLLTHFPDPQSHIEVLMNHHATIRPDIVVSNFGENLSSPLQIFSVIDDFSNDQDLLSRMARFYRPHLRVSANRIGLITELVFRERFDVLEYFLSVESDFHVFNFDGSGPVFRILLNRREELAMSIVNFHIIRGMRLAPESEIVLREANDELWRVYSRYTGLHPVRRTQLSNFI